MAHRMSTLKEYTVGLIDTSMMDLIQADKSGIEGDHDRKDKDKRDDDGKQHFSSVGSTFPLISLIGTLAVSLVIRPQAYFVIQIICSMLLLL